MGFPLRKGIKLGPLFTVEFEQQLALTIVTLLLGGGGVIAVWLTHRKTKKEEKQEAAQADASSAKDLSDAWQQVVKEQVESLVKPLQEKVEDDQKQIKHLEEQQRKLFAATKYIRSIGHWLGTTCEIFEPSWIATHPKPHLPDELREEIGDFT